MQLDLMQDGIVSRSLPQPHVDTQTVEGRFSRYGDQVNFTLIPDYYGVADEGSYFTALINSGTVGTGILCTAAATTAFTDGNGGAALVFQNADSNPTATNGKRIYLDYIKLICTTAIAGATSFNMAIKLDNVLSKYSSGGTVPTPLNPNMDAGGSSVARIAFGNPTTVATSSAGRLVWRQVIRAVATAPGVNDVIVINFGGVEKGVAQNLAQAIPALLAFNAPPIILGPNHTMTLHSWGAAQSTAPTLECEMGWFER